MKKRRHQYTDKDLLISMIIHAILEAETRLKRPPTKAEILDELFSPTRGDPEARDLERKLDRMITSLMSEWAELDEVEHRYQ